VTGVIDGDKGYFIRIENRFVFYHSKVRPTSQISVSSRDEVWNRAGTKAAGVSLSSPLQFPPGESAQGSSSSALPEEEPYRHGRRDYRGVANRVSRRSNIADRCGGLGRTGFADD
jgi:hypothetical protein